jgi:hypothetical protein
MTTATNLPTPRIDTFEGLVQAAYADHDLERYIHLLPRQDRLQAVLHCAAMWLADGHVVDGPTYWRVLGSVWTDADHGILPELDSWIEALEGWVGGVELTGRANFMEEGEHAALSALPETFTVYRGCAARRNEAGCSWTVNRSLAQWFADRRTSRGYQGIVIERVVTRSQIFALKLDREEAEVIILDDDTIAPAHRLAS